jgi:hypothetical protein
MSEIIEPFDQYRETRFSSSTPELSANRKVSENEHVGNAENQIRNAHRSQLAMPESAASDRIAFALYPL